MHLLVPPEWSYLALDLHYSTNVYSIQIDRATSTRYTFQGDGRLCHTCTRDVVVTRTCSFVLRRRTPASNFDNGATIVIQEHYPALRKLVESHDNPHKAYPFYRVVKVEVGILPCSWQCQSSHAQGTHDMLDASYEREMLAKLGRSYLRSLLSLSTHVHPLPSISPMCRMLEKVRNNRRGRMLEALEGVWA